MAGLDVRFRFVLDRLAMILVLATPVLTAALGLMTLERVWGVGVFDPALGSRVAGRLDLEQELRQRVAPGLLGNRQDAGSRNRRIHGQGGACDYDPADEGDRQDRQEKRRSPQEEREAHQDDGEEGHLVRFPGQKNVTQGTYRCDR